MKKLLVLLWLSHTSLAMAQGSDGNVSVDSAVTAQATVPTTSFRESPESTLELDEAIALATAQDPWLSGSRYRESALGDESDAVGTLPDPKLSLTAANLPTDSFDTNQEPMTQFNVGVTQMFPRGQSRALSSRQKREMAAREPILRRDRQAKVAATVAQLWLDAYNAQQSIRLIERNRSLFNHLVDASEASYSSAVGGARQQDIIRAQLELTRLDDRLTVLQQQLDTARQRLSEWIGSAAYQPISRVLPELDSTIKGLYQYAPDDSALYRRINHHPALQAFDKRIDAACTGIELAQQQYRPEWGINAKYGYRDDDPTGRERADLFSVGLIFDLPLFTGKRQDKQVSAAAATAEAIRTDRLLMARKLLAELKTAMAQWQRLTERDKLYRHTLLPQMTEQAEAALAAYNNDDGDFAEAVRARIAELNARIEALGIAVQRQQTLARLRYLLSGDSQTATNH